MRGKACLRASTGDKQLRADVGKLQVLQVVIVAAEVGGYAMLLEERH